MSNQSNMEGEWDLYIYIIFVHNQCSGWVVMDSLPGFVKK